jgi:hypothetical protein
MSITATSDIVARLTNALFLCAGKKFGTTTDNKIQIKMTLHKIAENCLYFFTRKWCDMCIAHSEPPCTTHHIGIV